MASNVAQDALQYVGTLSPLLLIIAGIAYGDLIIDFMIRIAKKGRIKW